MIIHFYDLADKQAILSGVQIGRKLFSRLVAQTAPPLGDEVAYLDCSGIEVATGSCLRESILAFRDYSRSTLQHLYPVVANASTAVFEELEFLLKHRKDALWTCRLDAGGQVSQATILGVLDPGQRSAFDLVASLRSASAPDLAALGDTAIGPTGWNNRLAALAARGLLMERRLNKTKIFTPVLETV